MTYVTKSGDMWDSIAHEQLGNEKYTNELLKANPEHISTYIFSSGVELTIPDIDTNEADESSLPPWKVAE